MKFFIGAVYGFVFGLGIFFIGGLLDIFGVDIGRIGQISPWTFIVLHTIAWAIINVVIDVIEAHWFSFSKITKAIIIVIAIFVGIPVIVMGVSWLLGGIIYGIVVLIVGACFLLANSL